MKESNCRVPSCARKGTYMRELCPSHYQMASRLVSQGKTTWEKLEAAGKVGKTRSTKRCIVTDYFLE